MSSESPSVFVVEDEPEMRESFAALFTSHELAVELFSSGEAFIERYNPSRPGCIVTDFRLQGINGIDLHRLLAETGCTLPVILISGYLNVRSAVNAISHGIYRVLEKPYREDELLSAVEEAIEENHKSREKKAYRIDFAHRLRLLDARERLTLEMIVAGQGNRAIECKLGLSTLTGDRIRSSILDKTGCLSFVELSAAYGAAIAGSEKMSPMTATGASDHCRKPGPDEGTLECLCGGLLRLQAVLLSDGQISEDSRLLLRDAEVALSKALCITRHKRGPASAASL